jgi:hypothetical protein
LLQGFCFRSACLREAMRNFRRAAADVLSQAAAASFAKPFHISSVRTRETSVKAFLRWISQLGVSFARNPAAQKHPAGSMVLSFPNSSRSYDVTRRAVRFWGNDSAMETSFYITEDALNRIQPGIAVDQSGILQAFDNNRPLIYAAAVRVYARGHRGSYDLVSADF